MQWMEGGSQVLIIDHCDLDLWWLGMGRDGELFGVVGFELPHFFSHVHGYNLLYEWDMREGG